MNSIKVFNNISEDRLHFESKEEFIRYYNKNKETIDKMSTRGLNMKISIEGYKIGRLKKELTLFSTDSALGKRLGSIHNSEQNKEQNIEQNDEQNILEIKIDNLNERLKKIEKNFGHDIIQTSKLILFFFLFYIINGIIHKQRYQFCF